MKSLFQRLSVIFFVAAMALSAGCTRIATGEAGVRVKQIIQTQNLLKVKQNEVAIAAQEALRMAALASQGQQSIAYMNAQATLNISEGVKNGKVSTIIVPSNFSGLGNFTK